MAEAEGEPEEGQRLVIDTILNRVDDPRFPDNVHDVIYQKNQFAGMYGERIERCYVKEELIQLVRESWRTARTARWSSSGLATIIPTASPCSRWGRIIFPVMSKGGAHYENLHQSPAVLRPGHRIGTLPGRRRHHFVQEVSGMDGFANLVSMLDYAVNTRRKRHLTGGLLISAALLFGGLAITVMSTKDEEEDYNE